MTSCLFTKKENRKFAHLRQQTLNWPATQRQTNYTRQSNDDSIQYWWRPPGGPSGGTCSGLQAPAAGCYRLRRALVTIIAENCLLCEQFSAMFVHVSHGYPSIRWQKNDNIRNINSQEKCTYWHKIPHFSRLRRRTGEPASSLSGGEDNVVGGKVSSRRGGILPCLLFLVFSSLLVVVGFTCPPPCLSDFVLTILRAR